MDKVPVWHSQGGQRGAVNEGEEAFGCDYEVLQAGQ